MHIFQHVTICASLSHSHVLKFMLKNLSHKDVLQIRVTKKFVAQRCAANSCCCCKKICRTKMCCKFVLQKKFVAQRCAANSCCKKFVAQICAANLCCKKFVAQTCATNSCCTIFRAKMCCKNSYCNKIAPKDKALFTKLSCECACGCVCGEERPTTTHCGLRCLFCERTVRQTLKLPLCNSANSSTHPQDFPANVQPFHGNARLSEGIQRVVTKIPGFLREFDENPRFFQESPSLVVESARFSQGIRSLIHGNLRISQGIRSPSVKIPGFSREFLQISKGNRSGIHETPRIS